MKSSTICNIGLVAVMRALENLVKSKNGHWKCMNGEQAYLRQMRAELGQWLDELGSDGRKAMGLEAHASYSIQTLNRILAENGYPNIQLQQPPGDPKDAVGSIAIFDREIEWVEPGKEAEINIPSLGMDVPGFMMSENFSIFASRNEHPVAVLNTKQGDKIYVQLANSAPQHALGLLTRAGEVLQGIERGKKLGYNELVIPMVDMEHQPDISFMQGFVLVDAQDGDGRDVTLTQALQLNRFRMDHIGALMQSASAVGGTRSFGSKNYVINGPFYVAWEVQGTVVFSAYIDTDVMKQPPREAVKESVQYGGRGDDDEEVGYARSGHVGGVKTPYSSLRRPQNK